MWTSSAFVLIIFRRKCRQPHYVCLNNPAVLHKNVSTFSHTYLLADSCGWLFSLTSSLVNYLKFIDPFAMMTKKNFFTWIYTGMVIWNEEFWQPEQITPKMLPNLAYLLPFPFTFSNQNVFFSYLPFRLYSSYQLCAVKWVFHTVSSRVSHVLDYLFVVKHARQLHWLLWMPPNVLTSQRLSNQSKQITTIAKTKFADTGVVVY